MGWLRPDRTQPLPTVDPTAPVYAHSATESPLVPTHPLEREDLQIGPGVVVSGWRVQERLGEGGFADVFRALPPPSPFSDRQQVDPDGRYAIKVCRPPRGTLKQQRDAEHAFALEAKALRRLVEPWAPEVEFIVPVLDYGLHGRLPFLVMPEQAESLHSLLEREARLSPLRTAQLLGPIALALAHAHGRKVLHRDVRPPNILLGFDGTPRLSDWGVAVLQDHTRVTVPGLALGVDEYKSPEYARTDQPTVGSDVWMLSCTAFHVVTGGKAFVGVPPAQRSWRTLDRTLLPPQLHDFFKRAFAEREGSRFSSAREWRGALDKAVGVADRAPLPVPAPPGPRPVPTAVVLAIFAVVALVALALAFLP